VTLKISELRAGDILLYQANNLVAKLIRKFDNAEVSHAGLYLGDGQVGEALIVGNPGVHRNPVAQSVSGCNWVEAFRAESVVDFSPVLGTASEFLDEGNRYAYEQIFMLAMILLTRKIDQSNWLVRQIAERTFSGCARLLQYWRTEDREPMICSEFVFRSYDEALPSELDQFTIEIAAQGTNQPRRMISRRRRRRVFGAAPLADSPTIHPDSLLAKLVDEPARVAAAPIMAGPPKSAEEIEAEIEAPGREYLGEQAPLRARTSSIAEPAATSREDVETAAAQFAEALLKSDSVYGKLSTIAGSGSAKASKMESVEQLKQVVADFVTPGDLHRSPSVSIVGRLDISRT